jgi:hypothetical protein
MGKANALNNLGTASSTAGRTADAHAEHSDALAIAERIGDQYEWFRTLAGLGTTRCHDNPAVAHQYWTQALDGFTRLGVPKAVELQRLVAVRCASGGRR